ncbi:ATP-binding protein [Leptospira ilyithenensis]|uniref:histidine kinase n=1 Tax=Leptospira ilyithenensis TaxID=2484901 RepID=A0A4R9LNR9_9LEPT|nr:ATP-binding protein [Leptospira ilyithenensis]TGN10415.1 response regulator [Leptospira ilyithenensis]
MKFWMFANRTAVYKFALQLVFVLFLILSFGVVWKIYTIQADEKVTIARLSWSQNLEDYLSALKDAETSQRGYLLTGDRDFLEPYFYAITQFPILEKVLLEQAEEKYKKDLIRIFEFSLKKRTEIKNRITEIDIGRKDLALLAVRSKVGKNLMDELRRNIAKLRKEKSIAEETDRLRKEKENTTLFTFCLVGFLTISALIVWMILLIIRNAKVESEKNEINSRFLEIDDLYQNSPVGFHSLDSEGNFLKMNDTALRWLGYTREEVIGKKSVFDFLAKGSEEIFKKEFLAFKERGYVDEVKIQFLKRNGEIMDIILSATAIKDASGKMLLSRSTFIDNTKSSEYERELVKAKKKAEEANLAKSEFLSSMSHELRTPLNAVIGLTILLLEENPKAEQIENLNNLKFSSETLLSLINDILDFSKIEERRISLESIVFRIDSLLGSVFKSFDQKAKEKLLKLVTHVDANFPSTVKADPTRLLQILNNLLSNAIKFTREGEISVNAKLVSQTDTSYMIQLQIQDTGIGIPEEKLQLIFDKFMQVSGDTTRRFGGSGLGLAISKGLLDLMGGTIEVKSIFGVGTTFTVTLPVERTLETIDTDVNLEHIDYTTLRGSRILIADDILINREIVARFLTKWGVEIGHAVDGIDVLDQLKSNHYDVILMDLHMPDMDGYQATQVIRKGDIVPDKKDIPIIALTASAQLETQEKIKEVGMNDYIAKPFLPKELYTKLKIQIRKNNS